MKNLFIAEKPSVAAEFAKALGVTARGSNGYIEQGDNIVTWCVGHLITMSYPDVYNPNLKKWSMDTIPFIPDEYKYEILPNTSKQFNIVKGLLNREDVGCIYVCTDSGREGEYIYRLVDAMAEVGDSKEKRRVWIDSQTEEEILRGIKEAKPLSFYDNLSTAAYLRAKEDYLMGINFSRALSLKYSYTVKQYLGLDRCVIAVGRVMTCVLGMIVKREREIRDFVPTPFYRVVAKAGKLEEVPSEMASVNKAANMSKAPFGNVSEAVQDLSGNVSEAVQDLSGNVSEAVQDLSGNVSEAVQDLSGNTGMENVQNLPGNNDSENVKNDKIRTSLFEAEWRAVEGSRYFEHPALYKENGFKKREDAEKLIEFLKTPEPVELIVNKVEKKTEKKNPPMLYNLAELQNDCSKLFKISPTETLAVVQELYEKKLVTYPRTDARVLSTAVSKEIYKNISGLRSFAKLSGFAQNILDSGSYKQIAKTKYCNDKQITDHYAIIPTGQGLKALDSVGALKAKVYELICRRFLSIFYPPAEYMKVAVILERNNEKFFSNFRRLVNPGYLQVAGQGTDNSNEKCSAELLAYVTGLKKGSVISCEGFDIREGETSAPKRYSSGTLILAMENAGQLIEDEELRAQIKGSGIGTSATRDSIISKLVNNKYIALNNKTQIVTPTFLGEIIYDVVLYSINGLLRADLTASWEKGLEGVAAGTISEDEYMSKMIDYVAKYTNFVKGITNQNGMRFIFDKSAPFYKSKAKSTK